MKRIAFLFGAGAEGKKNYDISLGDGFFEKSLMLDKSINKKDFGDTLKRYFDNISLADGDKAIKYKRCFISYDIADRNMDDRKTAQAFSRKLDSYFHCIIDPNEMGIDNYNKIFNYYWSCYFTIVRDVLAYFVKRGDKLSQQEAKQYLNDDLSIDYAKVIEDIRVLSNKMNTWVINEDNDSYYAIIDDRLKKINDISCSGIITSNYTPFVRRIDCNNVAYLNGKLSLFEFPQSLTVLDSHTDKSLWDERSQEMFFPFVFGQSYVKPIVDRKQIEEYSMFSSILSDSDILVVLGYRFNEDDNHINSFIRSFVVDDNRKIFVVREDDNKSDVCKCLKTRKEDNVEIVQVSYADNSNEEIIDKLLTAIGRCKVCQP